MLSRILSPVLGTRTHAWLLAVLLATPAAVLLAGDTRGDTSALSDLVVRDDDGTMETILDFDFGDDTAYKDLVLDSDDLTSATTAKLWIYAQGQNCGATGGMQELRVNGGSTSTYNPCSLWSGASFGWASIDVPVLSLRADASNRFQVFDQGGTWADRGSFFGIDSDNDYGRSVARSNGGADMPGELMWYLEIKVVVGPGAASGCYATEGASTDPQVYDYGDAPDSTNGTMPSHYQYFLNGGPFPGPPGEFPTLSDTNSSKYGTPGARHQVVDIGWLGQGSPPSRERDADETPDPDATTNFAHGWGDHDSGDDGLVPTILTPDNPYVSYWVKSSTGIHGWYVNMLIDWNYDGKWFGLDEWVIRDRRVSVLPGTTTLFTDYVGLGPLLYEPWVRLTLSDTPVSGGLLPAAWPDGWDGSTPPDTLDFDGNEAFACGETEDYCGPEHLSIQYVNPLQPRVFCRHDHA